jgi:probable phosphoglycerate mutase
VSRLLLLRHGESEWNAEGRWQGWADPPLSPLGREQAAEAARRLRPDGFSAVAASDLRRARHTAELIAAGLGLSGEIHTDSGLREYDLGAWSGLTRAEIEADWPAELAGWRHGRVDSAPGGEARDAFLGRLIAATGRVAATFPGRSVLVISHGGAIGTLERFLGIKPRRPVHLGGRWIHASGGSLRPGPERLVLQPDGRAP